jgi:glycerophosphoryl diester phosphodiesterase
VLMKPNYVRIYGHRGARGDYPENTIEGFEYLFSTGVKAFEFDVLIAKDSIPVLVHDFRLNISNTRDAQGQWLLNRDQKVNQMTSQELQQYDVGSINPSSSYGRRFKDQKQLDNIRIPTLAKLFELLNQNANKDVFLNLEIKSTPVEEGLTPKPNEMVQIILNEIKKSSLEDRTLISSFDWRIIKEFKKQAPNILRGHLSLQQDLGSFKKNISANSPWVDENITEIELFELPKVIKKLAGHAWCPFYRDVTKQNVELAHNLGLAVNTWTVNSESDFQRMIEYGVDGIITDYPKKLQDFCKSKNIAWF